MIWYNIFRFGFFAIFVGVHICMIAGLLREWACDRRCRLAQAAPQGPLVSVVIPVRNEAARMEGLLKSLAAQDYAPVEYIFVDDRSADQSPAMLRAFCEKRPNARIITLAENPGLNHKQYALSRGIAVSSGRLLLFTDADCSVPAGWIRAMVLRMAEKPVGLVLAPVFKSPSGKGFFDIYQCFDHAIRYMYLAGSTGLGAAGGGFGNNLIVSREALDAIGGYESLPPSPTEDAALVSRIRHKTRY
jgi:glycosyltransferase involved in cell wall biosynthesis